MDLNEEVQDNLGRYIGRRRAVDVLETLVDRERFFAAQNFPDMAGRPVLDQDQARLLENMRARDLALQELTADVNTGSFDDFRKGYFDTLNDDGKFELYEDFLERAEVKDDANDDLKKAAKHYKTAKALEGAIKSKHSIELYDIIRKLGANPDVLLGGHYSRSNDTLGLIALAKMIMAAQRANARKLLKEKEGLADKVVGLMSETDENAVNAVASMYNLYHLQDKDKDNKFIYRK